MKLRGRYRQFAAYYRQFEAVPEEEVNGQLRTDSAQRKAKQLAVTETLDLSETTPSQPPPADVVSAIAFAARRGLQRYPRGAELAGELAHRLDLPTERVVVGNGACELMRAAACALLRPGQKLLARWPGYPLLPLLAQHAHGIAVPVGGGVEELLEAAVEHEPRLVAIANPNDPTGELLGALELERLLAQLPETTAVLLDEALIEYAGRARERVSIELLERYPRMLVFRSFSKAWGLAGLRCGYAIGGPGAEELLRTIAPAHGVNELSAAAALESLRSCERSMRSRAQLVAQQREALVRELRARGCDVAESAASFLWVAHPELGGELAASLRDAGVLVASGLAFGEPLRVRVAVRDEAASRRLLKAIDRALDACAVPSSRASL